MLKPGASGCRSSASDWGSIVRRKELLQDMLRRTLGPDIEVRHGMEFLELNPRMMEVAMCRGRRWMVPWEAKCHRQGYLVACDCL